MTLATFHSAAPLRRAVRRLARGCGLNVETRARLALTVSLLADAEFRAGRTVSLEPVHRPGGELVLTVRSPDAPGPLATSGLPLPAHEEAPGRAVWRLTVPARPDPAGLVPRPAEPRSSQAESAADGAESEELAEELRVALARADTLDAEHRRLKHELAETNSGVLALYVQLEERDERLRRAHGRILRELEDALRPPPIRSEGLELAVHYAPADTDAPTGGDLYDWFFLPDGTVHITVVDALGHGVRSTRSALNVTHAVRTLALEGHPLGSIVARTDEILMPLDRELMATVLLARLNPRTGELRLANGSHPPALLLRADGGAEYLEVRGRGIGFPLPGSERLLHDRMDPGDLLLLYTDGLTESRRDPREGEARLVESARRHRDLPVTEIPGALAHDMHTVVLHRDDTLAIAVRLSGVRSSVG
ncbi:PP2C family protein-serine/threonine phosphatase [Streptomyces sp. TRM 70351]|uniref:PP2C family protein-serine/threonine phosphatase n=1 Tax=Streptomyces sp. TRM 70351 TaxID=3116552 RepID=UPI002E7C3714|nr:PP2C family protein-serine/threonine phosphatase [Streptomyces sp. TRM 70351]MEE1927953.1 PP2C family protein-serine/threonine phosphatase [Streptomyces sp. TRM 70351]